MTQGPEDCTDGTKRAENDTPVAIASLTHGATLGEMALIDRERRSASAIATL